MIPIRGSRLHTRNRQLRNRRGFSVAFSSGVPVAFSSGNSLFRYVLLTGGLYISGQKITHQISHMYIYIYIYTYIHIYFYIYSVNITHQISQKWKSIEECLGAAGAPARLPIIIISISCIVMKLVVSINRLVSSSNMSSK